MTTGLEANARNFLDLIYSQFFDQKIYPIKADFKIVLPLISATPY